MFKKLTKSKKSEEGIQIQALSENEHEVTRPLWEDTFDEDSKEFVDFYYTYKVEENSIWVAKDDEVILSMVQLNPYQLHFGSSIVLAHYIVGVATHEEFRRQGLMKKVLISVFRHMYENKEPFTYLMPAKEEYYTGFDFATVYYQKRGILSNTLGETNLIFKSATEEDFKKLAVFSEELLSEKYRVFAQRDENYYQMIKKQFEAEHGEVICVYDDAALVGYFFYGEYEAIEVMEPVCLDLYKNEFIGIIANKFKESMKEIKVTAFDLLNEDDFKNIVTKPVTMVRIVSLEMFVSHLKAVEPIELVIEIKDEYIDENNGIFAFKIGRIESKIELTSKAPELTLGISELTLLCFYEEIPKVMEEQMNETTMDKIKKIVKFTPIFLNELV